VVVARFVSRLRAREMEDVVVVVRSFWLAFASEGGGGGRGGGCELVVGRCGSCS
jgi:hypothetical protein